MPSRFPVVEVVARQTHDRGADFGGGRLCGKRRAEEHGDGISQERRPALDELAVVVAVDRAPGAAEVGRDDRIVAVLHDLLEPAPEFVEHAGPRQRAFGEDANDVALVHRRPRGMQRLDEFFRRVVHRDRDHAPQLQKRFQESHGFVHVARHEKANPPLLGRLQQQGVEVGHVVADQQGRAFHRDVFGADHANPVRQPRDDDEDEAQKEIGQHLERDDRQRQRQQAHHHEALRGRDLQRTEQEHEPRRQQHADPAQEARGRQDFAQLLTRRAKLDEGIEGDDKQAGAQPGEKNHRVHGGKTRRNKVQHHRGARQHQRTERHDAEFDVTSGEFPRAHRAHRDADRGGEEQVGALFLCKTQVLDSVGDHVQLQEGAQQHEVRGRNYRLQEITILPDRPQVAPDVPHKHGRRFFCRAGRHRVWNKQAGQQPGHGDCKATQLGLSVAGMHQLREQRRAGGAQDDRQVCVKDQLAVGLGQ